MESVARTSGNVSHPSTAAWLSSTLHSYPGAKRKQGQSLRQQNNTEPITKPTGIVINQTELKEKISSWQQVISIQKLRRESQMSSKPGMARSYTV